MNRVWVTGLTIAGVVGTGGAAMAGLSDSPIEPSISPPRAAVPVALVADTIGSAATSIISYQVGPVGTVTISYGATGATVTEATPAVGWTVTSASAVGNHVEIVFAGATQTVTFGADLVNGELIPAVSSVPVAGAPAPAPITVTVIERPSTQASMSTFPLVPDSAIAPTITPAVTPMMPPASGPSSFDDDQGDDQGEDQDDEQGEPPAGDRPVPTTVSKPVSVTAPLPSATTSPSGGEHDDGQVEEHEVEHEDSHAEVGDDD